MDLRADGRLVLAAIARHYGGAVPILAGNSKWRPRVDAATAVAWAHSANLGKSGQKLSAMCTRVPLWRAKLEKIWGHSTPPFIVEYVLGRLRNAILSIPIDRRVNSRTSLRPRCISRCCSAIASGRGPADPIARHDYLRARLRGQEIDHAAKEMARLSLTLADVPNSDGWDLREGDMFIGDALVELARGGTVLQQIHHSKTLKRRAGSDSLTKVTSLFCRTRRQKCFGVCCPRWITML